MATVFRSKVDRKLKVIGFATPCVALLAIATSARGPAALWLPVIPAVLVTVIVVWVVLSTYYEFSGDQLLIRSGPFFWRVPLEEISSVRESSSLRSGPALSMDRLEITFCGGRVLLISPEDKAGFLAALQRRAPRLAS
jgi:Bacterial PH domain